MEQVTKIGWSGERLDPTTAMVVHTALHPDNSMYARDEVRTQRGPPVKRTTSAHTLNPPNVCVFPQRHDPWQPPSAAGHFRSTNPRSGTIILDLTIADEVNTRGYAIIPAVLDGAQVTHLRSVLERLIAEDLAHPDPPPARRLDGVQRRRCATTRSPRSSPTRTSFRTSRRSSGPPASCTRASARACRPTAPTSRSGPRRQPARHPVVPDQRRRDDRAHRFHRGERRHALPSRFVRAARSADREEFDRDAEMVFPTAGTP